MKLITMIYRLILSWNKPNYLLKKHQKQYRLIFNDNCIKEIIMGIGYELKCKYCDYIDTFKIGLGNIPLFWKPSIENFNYFISQKEFNYLKN